MRLWSWKYSLFFTSTSTLAQRIPRRMLNTIAGSFFFYQQDDVLLCKVFPKSLEEGFVAWFQQLSPHSVTSFADMLTWLAQVYELQI